MVVNNINLFDDILTTQKHLSSTSDVIVTAHATFTNHYNSFVSLAEQLQAKVKELAEREGIVEKREREVAEKAQQLQEKENNFTEREKKLVEKERELATKEERWGETEKRMQQNAAKLPSVIKLNVSGQSFAVMKEKLLQHKGSLFEQMIVSDHSQQIPTGEIFIERDPKYFKHVVRFIIKGSLLPPSDVSEQELIEEEFAFCNIPFKFSFPAYFFPRTIPDMLVDNRFVGAIQSWLPQKRFKLLYKASEDGFAAADFHKICDDKGPTLTIIRSKNGYLFGGYAPLSWDSTTKRYKEHTEGFIFTLTNPHNIPPTKYPLIIHSYAISCNPSYGPTFGAGHDIYVADNSQNNLSSYTKFHSYTDTTGKGIDTFTGAQNFATTDIEVFAIF
jgi:hypothetical protein